MYKSINVFTHPFTNPSHKSKYSCLKGDNDILDRSVGILHLTRPP